MASSPHRSPSKSKAKPPHQSHHKKSAEPAPSESSQKDLVFGRHSVLSCLEQGRPLDRIWLVASLQKDSRFQPLLQQAKQQGTVIQKTDPQHLNRLSQGGNHQGIVAQMAAYQYQDLEDLVAAAKAATDFPVLIAADGITDPHNLGAIIRTAEAFRTQGVVIPQRRSASVCATVPHHTRSHNWYSFSRRQLGFARRRFNRTQRFPTHRFDDNRQPPTTGRQRQNSPRRYPICGSRQIR